MRQTVVWRVRPETLLFSQAELEWLRASGLEIKIESPPRLSIHDSLWCDASTGLEILTSQHKIFVKTDTPEQETWIKLYWDNRADAVEIGQCP